MASADPLDRKDASGLFKSAFSSREQEFALLENAPASEQANPDEMAAAVLPDQAAFKNPKSPACYGWCDIQLLPVGEPRASK